MKAKKGSARTRKFASGGDIAAGLVGLGTLGYLLSKKKDKEKEDAGTMSSIGEKSDVADKILSRSVSSAAQESDEEKRAKAASQGRPELIPEGADEATMRSDTVAKRVTPVSKPVIKSAKPVSAPDTTKRARNPKIVEKEIDAGEGTKEGKESAKRRYREGYKLLQDEQKTKGDPSIEENRPTKEPPYNPNKVSKTSAKAPPKLKPGQSKVVGEGSLKPYPKDAADKSLREQRKQQLGANYAAQKRALDTAPEGPGKEALKKSVEKARRDYESSPMKRGGMVKKYASGGSVKSSASKRADGIAQRGKTRGRMV